MMMKAKNSKNGSIYSAVFAESKVANRDLFFTGILDTTQGDSKGRLTIKQRTRSTHEPRQCMDLAKRKGCIQDCRFITQRIEAF
jgi:hypothetical protein